MFRVGSLVNHTLSILPFETKYFELAGLGSKNTFVGHPAVDLLLDSHFGS